MQNEYPRIQRMQCKWGQSENYIYIYSYNSLYCKADTSTIVDNRAMNVRHLLDVPFKQKMNKSFIEI